MPIDDLLLALQAAKERNEMVITNANFSFFIESFPFRELRHTLRVRVANKKGLTRLRCKSFWYFLVPLVRLEQTTY